MSFLAHVAVLGLLVLDLAVGGPVVGKLAGHWGVIGFEFLLILGYALFVLQVAPWRRPRGGGGDGQSE